MVELERAKKYMHIDYDDDDDIINVCIFAADEYLSGAIGEDFDISSGRAEMLALMVIADLYDNRSSTEAVSAKTRTIVENFAQQLRLELRGKKDDIST